MTNNFVLSSFSKVPDLGEWAMELGMVEIPNGDTIFEWSFGEKELSPWEQVVNASHLMVNAKIDSSVAKKFVADMLAGRMPAPLTRVPEWFRSLDESEQEWTYFEAISEADDLLRIKPSEYSMETMRKICLKRNDLEAVRHLLRTTIAREPFRLSELLKEIDKKYEEHVRCYKGEVFFDDELLKQAALTPDTEDPEFRERWWCSLSTADCE